jgi:glucose/arabinose dehydrogenase
MVPVRRTRRTRPSFRPRVDALEGRELLTSLPAGFSETVVATGLTNPTAMDFAPDGRLFVLEQGGNVKLVHSDGTTATALHLNVDSQGERGLLGIAFDPNFGVNHFVYLYYTNPNPGGAPWASGEHNQLSRFTVDDTDPQHPTFTQEAPILDWDNLSSATNHNGGAIHFGLDGMLYADAGDNVQTFTQAGHTYRVSQTLANLLGKQLRIDVANFNSGLATRDDTTVGHLIPADNPFVGTATGINQLIYALGLRNPFTFAVQPGTGTIFINDVGETTWEEIDRSVAGGNYGWSGGNTDGFGQSPPGPGTYQDPLLAYPHVGGPAGGGDAIVGGTFYNPATPQFPVGYVGKYFYADLGGGWIRVFDPAHPGSASTPDTSTAFATGTPGSLRDLKVDAAGNLYYLAGNGGEVVRISYQAAPGGGQPGPTPSPPGPSAQPAADVTALVVIRRRRTLRDPGRGRVRQRVTIVNVSGVPIPGPLSLALDGLGRGTRLLHAAGVTQFTAIEGSPFVTALLGAGDVLAPGGGVNLTLDFRIRAGRHLAYRPRVLAGVGLR